MTDFVDKLKLKEQAEEDLYFARRDRELLGARAAAPRQAIQGPRMVFSGGQAGVDRAALELGLAVGGWCPAGRRAEDGVILDHHPLWETPSGNYAQRTEWYVRDSDATLIVYRGRLEGGTRLIAGLARRYGRPLLCRDLGEPPAPADVAHWLRLNRVAAVNCAGPRASEAPGIEEQARGFF